MSAKIALLTAALALACGAPVLAHGGQTHIMGTVAAVEPDRLVVQDREGQTVSVRVTKDTRYQRDGARAGAGRLATGDRVVVEAAEREGTLTATEIRSSSRPAKGGDEKSHGDYHERPRR